MLGPRCSFLIVQSVDSLWGEKSNNNPEFVIKHRFIILTIPLLFFIVLGFVNSGFKWKFLLYGYNWLFSFKNFFDVYREKKRLQRFATS